MKAILQPNPNKQPVIKYDRVTDIRKKMEFRLKLQLKKEN